MLRLIGIQTINAPFNVMSGEGVWPEPGDSDTEINGQNPTRGHRWISESHTISRVYGHFCYIIGCQNAPGSILLNKARLKFTRVNITQ